MAKKQLGPKEGAWPPKLCARVPDSGGCSMTRQTVRRRASTAVPRAHANSRTRSAQRNACGRGSGMEKSYSCGALRQCLPIDQIDTTQSKRWVLLRFRRSTHLHWCWRGLVLCSSFRLGATANHHYRSCASSQCTSTDQGPENQAGVGTGVGKAARVGQGSATRGAGNGSAGVGQ